MITWQLAEFDDLSVNGDQIYLEIYIIYIFQNDLFACACL